MTSIVSHIVVVLVIRVLSDGSVNWSQVKRRNQPQKPVIPWCFEEEQNCKCVQNWKRNIDTSEKKQKLEVSISRGKGIQANDVN